MLDVSIHVDGASRFNNDKNTPSEARTCVVIPELDFIKVNKKGELTNNQAEWEAFIEGLRQLAVKRIGKLCPDPEKIWENVTIYSDSQLVVNQFNGKWKCKNKHLKPYLDLAQRFVKHKYLKFNLVWIPRDKNLAGKILEGG